MSEVKKQFQSFIDEAAKKREQRKESHRLVQEELDRKFLDQREPSVQDFCQKWIEKEVWNRIQLAGIEWIPEFAELLTEAIGKEVSEYDVRQWVAGVTLTGSCSYCDTREVFDAFRYNDSHFETWVEELMEPEDEPDIDDGVYEGEPYPTRDVNEEESPF